MNPLSLADLHCDTPFELFYRKSSFENNDLAVSAQKANKYSRFLQVAAIWSDKHLDDDSAYRRTLEVIDNFKADVENAHNASFWIDSQNMDISFILSIEDARILNRDISRLYDLYDKGIRIITPLWRGESCIGGAYDTDTGLSDFGKLTIEVSAELGMIPDISHASTRSAYDILTICDSRIPVIASHSDAYFVFPHSRNLTDDLFYAIKQNGGVVGINLCAEHLGYVKTRSATDCVICHIEHYLSLGGEDMVCFGCDFDGATTPPQLSDITSLFLIADKMSALNYSDRLIEKLFYINAENFIKKNIK